MSKIAYRYNSSIGNKYVGEQECQIDPIASQKAGKEIYLLPGDCTYIKPELEEKEGSDIVFNTKENKWEYFEIPKAENSNPQNQQEEDKSLQIDREYENNKLMLQNYYIQFMINGDTEGMESIKEELKSLSEQYDKDIEFLKEGEE